MKRRSFLKNFSLAAGSTVSIHHLSLAGIQSIQALQQPVDNFNRADSLYHGDAWESLNPGYWLIKNGALRRRLQNVGDQNPVTRYPWHWETHASKPMPQVIDPSLPMGMIWNRKWKLTGNFKLVAHLTIKNLPPSGSTVDRNRTPKWQQETPGYALMGLCFGGKTLYESRYWSTNAENAALMALWKDNQKFGIYSHASENPDPYQENTEEEGINLQAADQVTMEVLVTGNDTQQADVKAVLNHKSIKYEVTLPAMDRGTFTDGYFGLIGRGLLDFEVNEVSIEPHKNEPLDAPLNELHTCYPLGDTLRKVGEEWYCKFIAITRNEGGEIVIKITDREQPGFGWDHVQEAGRGKLVNNEFRRNTAVIEAKLPYNPAATTMYYTVWKDGRDITGDPRVGTESMGEGTGLVPFPYQNGNYVGRLPRLSAPYKMAGFSCHAITGGKSDLPGIEPFQENWVHDQPTTGCYHQFEAYDFQILNWNDDVWYLELVFPPPSTDDAYKIITLTIAGPTSRWQMMRHWNVVHPGDHDFGMDDVKGPEQYILRHHNDLGQDMYYLRRNFKVNMHLTLGDENPSGTENPKLWRRWKMPRQDFSLLIMDARLWRTTQETDIWSDWGWGHKRDLYSRTNPVRSLLGEEQYAWLEQMIHTDSAPLICVSGINNMHPVFQGVVTNSQTGQKWLESDRVAADYASWAKAGCDRVIDLLSSRQGVISVFGDIHLGHILENTDKGLIEASFGPIGRDGARGLKEDWAPEMKDYDGRPVKIHALYHLDYQTPALDPREGPVHWNFMEMSFDPVQKDPTMQLSIRHLTDGPGSMPRGGETFSRKASQTGKTVSSRMPEEKVLPKADVYFSHITGEPIVATRSDEDGTLPLTGFIDIPPDTNILMVSVSVTQTEAKMIKTIA